MAILGSILSAVMGSQSSDKASEAQANSAAASLGLQKEMWQQSREDTAPWREEGANALSKLADLVYSGPGDYTKSPGYDFRLSEGNKAIERSAAARGNVLGGKTLKALTKYGQEYATNDYDNFLRRYYESMTPLQSLAGLGQSTAAQTAALGGNAANGMANAITQMGNAQAAGTINSANAVTGALNSGINNAIAGYSAWKNYSTPANTANYSGYDGYIPSVSDDIDYSGGGYSMYGMQ